MKRILFMVVGLIVVGTVGLDAQAQVDLDALVRRGDVYLHPETREPHDGPVFARFDEGVAREQGVLKDGRKDGRYEYFYLSGRLRMMETYREGVLHGPSETYFKNGQLADKGTYREGEWDGPYEAYWVRGWLAEQGSWTRGERCGDWTSFGQTIMYPPCPN